MSTVKEYEEQTRSLLQGTIVLIILGMGIVAIGLSAQAWRTLNDSVFPFVERVDTNIQDNITYFETNQTNQIHLLSMLTQEAISVLMQMQMIEPPASIIVEGSNTTTGASPLNMTLVVGGHARLVSPNCNSPAPTSYAALAAGGFPNVTYQVVRANLNYGLVLYILKLQPTSLSAPLILNHLVAGTGCRLRLYFDTFDLFGDAGAVGTFIRDFLIPSPFLINGCTYPQCAASPTLAVSVRNAISSSAYLDVSAFFTPTAPLPSAGMNITIDTALSQIYILLS
jgi:hypothetical protein